ncbi:DUF2029 domain-containing protein [Clostridiaceae bacterium Marseille-Q4143]|nr:DUF2029 domain-containing protein [Clostridiaceae bacterium Marseille-Q4143]
MSKVRFEHWKNNIDPKVLFGFGGIICFVILGIVLLLSHGNLWSSIFWHDQCDTGMDFFHSIEYVRGRTPYLKYDTLYPPLANLFFLFVYYFIPREISQTWADTFELSVEQRCTRYDLRLYQSCMMMFVFLVVITTLLLVLLIKNILKRCEEWKVNLVTIAAVCSYGILYSFERGNIIVLVMILLLFYINNYDSEKKYLKELALIALAISSGLKLYPAFLGILLLRKRDIQGAIKCIIYGIIAVFMPFVFFKEGIEGLFIWLKVIAKFGSDGTAVYIGNSAVNILHRVSNMVCRLFKVEFSSEIIMILSLLIILIFLLLAYMQKEEWKSILLLTLSIILFQNQGDYIFSLLLLPLIIFFASENKLKKSNFVPIMVIMFLTWPLPIFSSFYGVNLRNIWSQIGLSVLGIWSIQDFVYSKNFFHDSKRMSSTDIF